MPVMNSLKLLLFSERAACKQSVPGVQIIKTQYSHYGTLSAKGMPGSCITAKCIQYSDKFW